MRKLLVKDAFRVIDLVGKLKLPEAPPNTDEAGLRRYGLAIFQALLQQATGDVKVWFADLLEVTPDDFEAMPITALLDIIEGLFTSKEGRDFFERVGKMLSGQSLTRSSTDTAGPTKKSSA